MPNVYRSEAAGAGLRVGIVVARWNSLVTGRLLEGALAALAQRGVAEDHIDVAWVPGAWEVAIAAQRLARSERYDALIALGAVIRGETPHFEYIATQVSAGLTQVSLATGVPVAFGVLTTNTVEQALDRAGGKHGHKGAEAADAAIEMAGLLRRLDGASGES